MLNDQDLPPPLRSKDQPPLPAAEELPLGAPPDTLPPEEPPSEPPFEPFLRRS